MRILITGSTGMVGRNLIENNKIAKHELLIPTKNELNLKNYRAIDKFILTEKPDLIIHTAGKVGGIKANISDPASFLVENIDMARNLILSARKGGIKKLINLGSSCIYSKSGKNPLKEDSVLTGELEPTNEGYALAKIFALKLCSYISDSDQNVHYKTIIPCNLFGKYDKFEKELSHMIPAVIARLHKAKIEEMDYVEIWGDGKARREFMFAEEFGDFMSHAVERFDEMPNVMNVGIGHDYSINEYYDIIADVIGYQGTFRHDHSQPVGMKQKLVDISKLEKFGWGNKSSLIDGISKTYKFYLENYNL